MSKVPALKAVDVAALVGDTLEDLDIVSINGHEYKLEAGYDSEQVVFLEFISLELDGPTSSEGFTVTVRKHRA